MSLRSVLLEFAESRGGAEAILAPGREPLTFSGLTQRIEVLKEQLNGLGVGHGDRVVAVLPNGPEMAVCYLAVATFATFAIFAPSREMAHSPTCGRHSGRSEGAQHTFEVVVRSEVDHDPTGLLAPQRDLHLCTEVFSELVLQ